MAFPKVFERPVGVPQDQAYAIVRRWVAELNAKVKGEIPPARVDAEWGKTFRLAVQANSKKIFIIECLPIQGGTLVRATMILSKFYADDALTFEPQITKSWGGFLDPLWVRLGYPPTPRA